MANSKRQQILDKFKSILQTTITTDADAYNFDIPKKCVSLRFRTLEDVNQADMPFLVIVPGPSPYSQETNASYTSGRGSKRGDDGWLISILGHVAAKNDVDDDGCLVVESEKLIQDIMKAMESVNRLELGFVECISLINAEQYANDGDTKGSVFLTYAVRYNYDKDTP